MAKSAKAAAKTLQRVSDCTRDEPKTCAFQVLSALRFSEIQTSKTIISRKRTWQFAIFCQHVGLSKHVPLN